MRTRRKQREENTDNRKGSFVCPINSLKSVVVSLSLGGAGVAAAGEVGWQRTPERATAETEE